MIKLIEGGSSTDSRGRIRFVNDFNMEFVKRFYLIKNAGSSVVRGWRGHRIEQRWFFSVVGSFDIRIVEIDNWLAPDRDSTILCYKLKANDNIVLNVPNGYATAISSIEENSELLVFSDFDIHHAKEDDYYYDLDYFHQFSSKSLGLE